jgi:hypothetical protein
MTLKWSRDDIVLQMFRPIKHSRGTGDKPSGSWLDSSLGLLTKNHNQKDCIFVTVAVIQQAITPYFVVAVSLSASQSVTAVWIESLSRAISSPGQGSRSGVQDAVELTVIRMLMVVQG